MTCNDTTLIVSKSRLLSHKNIKKYDFVWVIKNLNFYTKFDRVKLKSPFKMDEGTLTLKWKAVVSWKDYDINCNDDSIVDWCTDDIVKGIEITAVLNIQQECNIIISLSVLDAQNNKMIKHEKSYLVPGSDSEVKFQLIPMSAFNDIKSNTIVVNCCLEIAGKDDIHKEIDYLIPPTELYSPSDNTKLLKDKKYSDIKLIVSGKEILAHKCILAANSKVFEAMFDTDMKEKQENVVNIEDINYPEFKLAIEYMYGKKIEAPTKILLLLFVVADKYDINGLSEYCEIKLFNEIDSKNAKKMFGIAEKYNLKNLEKKAIETMYANLNL